MDMTIDIRHSVDPESVSVRVLSNGMRIPVIGFGTNGCSNASDDAVCKMVEKAIRVGYRLFDCAPAYGNQKAVGKAFRKCLDAGIVSREELVITSKLWNFSNSDRNALVSCAESLRDLQLDYIDIYLIHWPFPNDSFDCTNDDLDENARPYIREEYLSVWRELERLVDLGLVHGIGTSNMTTAKMKELLPLMRIRPVVNEMEMHPTFQQMQFRDFLLAERVQPLAYCPLGNPNRPDCDKRDSDPCDILDEVVISVAQKHGCHPAEVCLKWAIQCGAIPIPFTTSETHLYSNLNSSLLEDFGSAEMEALQTVEANCRLVRGQSLLWKGVTDWKVLWDGEE